MGFHGEVLSAPRPTPKLEDHPLSAVRDCLFNTLHIGGRSSIRNLRTRHAVVTRAQIYWGHQCGFRRNRSATDHIFCIRQILERKREQNEAAHQLYGGTDWINLDQERDRWRALVNVVMNLQVP